ncbi:unnamed protein product, partial [Heterosigma akashiwo]
KETFVGFVHVPDTSGLAIKNALERHLRDTLKLDMGIMRAQGYDGAGNMAGCNIGVQKLMTELYPLCIYFHCLCHCLNLAINSTCQLATIASFISVMESLTVAFKMSPKRQHHLLQKLQDPRYNHNHGSATKKKVATFCQTRWAQRSDSMTTVKNALPALEQTFITLDGLPTNQRDKDAAQYKLMLNEFSFIIVLCMMEKTFALLLVLCVALQKQEIDMYEGIRQTTSVVEQLEKYMTHDEGLFGTLFAEAVHLSTLLEDDVEVRVPRNYRRQAGLNQNQEDVKQFYRTTIWLPYLEHLCSQLRIRMLDNEEKLLCLLLVPSPGNLTRLSHFSDHALLELFKPFRGDNNDLSNATDAQLLAEITLWLKRWNRICAGQDDGGHVTDLPHSIADTLNSSHVNINSFPNIKTVLLVMGVWPVTTASVERIISLLRRLKPWLRNRMTNERMNSLALMLANPDFKMDYDGILLQWAQKHKR